MDLLEYQGKQLFAKHGVPVSPGRPATTVQEAVAAADELGYPVVVKAQVLVGGRGKAGGVKLADDREQAEEHAGAILGLDIKGLRVRELWIEKASEIEEEYYAAFVFDRSAKKPMAMFSKMGGMDVEAITDEDPEAMRMLHVDPLLGFQDFHGRRLAFEADIAEDVIRPVGVMLGKLYEVFVAEDATLVEVNPLIVKTDRSLLALDAKVTIDDNALYRHPDTAEMRNISDEDPQESLAKERGLTYVPLEGNIGILGNGAGLVMSTLDVIALAGGRAANFCDLGGGGDAEGVVDALEVITRDPQVKSIFFNIFGGITRCDEVAKGILAALERMTIELPIVVRLDGTNAEEGRKILADAAIQNVHPEATMLDGARRAVELAA